MHIYSVIWKRAGIFILLKLVACLETYTTLDILFVVPEH